MIFKQLSSKFNYYYNLTSMFPNNEKKYILMKCNHNKSCNIGRSAYTKVLDLT